MHIRPLEPRDLDAVRAIFNHIVEHEDCFINEHPLPPPAFCRLVCGEVSCFVAEEGGRVAGFYYLHPLREGRASHIANGTYGVAVDCRGKGVGLALGRHSIRTARAQGYRYLIFTSVLASNTAANRLWRRLGFRRQFTLEHGYRTHEGKRVATHQYVLDLGAGTKA